MSSFLFNSEAKPIQKKNDFIHVRRHSPLHPISIPNVCVIDPKTSDHRLFDYLMHLICIALHSIAVRYYSVFLLFFPLFLFTVVVSECPRVFMMIIPFSQKDFRWILNILSWSSSFDWQINFYELEWSMEDQNSCFWKPSKTMDSNYETASFFVSVKDNLCGRYTSMVNGSFIPEFLFPWIKEWKRIAQRHLYFIPNRSIFHVFQVPSRIHAIFK